jgi:hypothetical protein
VYFTAFKNSGSAGSRIPIHSGGWKKFDRYNDSVVLIQRHRMLAGFRLVYPDGSFVTRKQHPGDFDACWDVQNVDDARLDPVFWDFSRGRAAQKQRFLGELFPAQLPEGATGRAFVDFFQVNKMSGEPKGILAIRLRRSRRK